MEARPDTALYFTTAVALERDLAVLGGHLYIEGAEPSVTRFMICNNGEWFHLKDFDEVVYAAVKKPVPVGARRGPLCVLGRRGHFQETPSGQAAIDGMIDTSSAGYLMDLRLIGGSLYACGVQNQVHRQVQGRWLRMDEGIFKPLGETVDRILESIDGFAEDDIYAVGSQGSIYHWNGKRWQKIETPTNLPFFSVLCASDGYVYVGGSGGLLYRGRHGQPWKELTDPDVTESSYVGMTEFQGKVYLTATEVLVVTDGDTAEVVDVPLDGEKAYYAVDSHPEALWCVGDECVLQYDGRDWRRFICPDNG